jgi:uncharacterized protein YgiM (DUF1202 family)
MILEGTLMKKRLIALLLVLILVVPAGLAAAATWYRVNTSSLKVRFLPGENAEVLGSYRRDWALNISNKTNDGWAYALFSNGFEGYVQFKYLAKTKSYYAWVTSDQTSLRRGPDGEFAALAMLAKGFRVTVLTHGANYDFVSAGKFGNGYIVNSRLSKKKVKPSGNQSYSTSVSGGDYDAYVMSTGKVKLRRSPNSNSPVIAKYKPGTKVHVITHGAEWDKVTVEGNTGWMLTKYLTTSEPAPTPTPSPKPGDDSYTAYVVTEDKGPIRVRKGNSTNYAVLFTINYGTPVTVLKHNKKWDYIEYNFKRGYVQNEYLQLAKPADAPDMTPVPDPTPTPVFVEYEAFITSPDGKSVNFHKGKGDGYSNVDGVGRLPVGTQVTVKKIEDGWAKILYVDKNKKEYLGWVHKEFLKKAK